jgi:ribosomal protein S18 acetylase RimI-like enzyme
MVGSAPYSVSDRVVLRPVTDADHEFLVGVYASTRQEELDQVAWPPGARESFIRMQFRAQDVDYRRNNPDASYDVIEVDGQPAGRLYVDRRTGDLRVIDIALLPEFRGRGLGGRLLRSLLDEAAASGSKVSIHVEVHNPAARLYGRLGFVVVEEQGFYQRMERVAP